MSQTPDQPQPLPRATVPPAPPPPPPSGRFPVMGCFFVISFLLNILLGGLLVVACLGLFARGVGEAGSSTSPTEKQFTGTATSKNKVAIVTLDGPLMDGMLGNVEKQIEAAAKDDAVKAVVFRVNSPGGSITASDDIHRRLVKLRDGEKDKNRSAKPLVVSMAGIAASGGYYVAMPGQHVLAETGCITGSIGVYASFPNLEGFGKQHGVTFNTIKAGELKAMGAIFRKMEPREEQVIQDMVDDAYVQFLGVVEKGRPKLTRGVMLERFTVQPLNPDPKANPEKERKPYERYRADGAIYTAGRALKLGLIDGIGTLEDAVVEAAKRASLTEYRAIKYQKPQTLTDYLLGARVQPPAGLSLDAVRPLFSPRLWYLAPGYEAAVRLGEGQP